jgi:hypothetical protein
MRIIAGVIIAAAVASCAPVSNDQGRSDEPKPTANQAESTRALRILREISGGHAEQVRLDVEAMMQGIAEAHGTRLAVVPELQRPPSE